MMAQAPYPPCSMPLLSFDRTSISFGRHPLLELASFQIEPGWQKMEQMQGTGSATGVEAYNKGALERLRQSLGKRGGGY